MPESANAVRIDYLEKWVAKWEPRIEAAERLPIWVGGICTGIGFVVSLVTMGLLKVFIVVPH